MLFYYRILKYKELLPSKEKVLSIVLVKINFYLVNIWWGGREKIQNLDKLAYTNILPPLRLTPPPHTHKHNPITWHQSPPTCEQFLFIKILAEIF